MTTPKKTPEQFLRTLENGVRVLLKDKATTPADKLKAIEVGAKIAAIQLKKASGDDESFFN